MMDFQKHFSDPMSSAMLFTKDAKGNMVIKPEAKPQAEQYAATAGVLLQSPHPVDKQRAAGILNNLLDVKGISRADYDMLMKGVPFTASYGGAVPAAVPAAVPSPIPSNQVTPTSSVSGSSALSRYSLGPPEIYKGSAATEDVIGAVAGFPSAALRRLRKDFYAGPANQ